MDVCLRYIPLFKTKHLIVYEGIILRHELRRRPLIKLLKIFLVCQYLLKYQTKEQQFTKREFSFTFTFGYLKIRLNKTHTIC